MSSPVAQFGGEEHFRASPERLYALLTDLEAMIPTIPDLQSAERIDEHSMRYVVRPGFSFVRGTMKVVIALADMRPSEQARMSVSAQGIGASMRISSNMRITPEGGGSKLDWDARIEEKKGLLSAVSASLITAAADQVIRRAWDEVRKQLGE
ncbi:MAG: SRPBCC family protein [Planctomycetia bacterium]|nr:SRPBCC family protein [Planctomycetia bacterium]